jgi:hypothetical protein
MPDTKRWCGPCQREVTPLKNGHCPRCSTFLPKPKGLSKNRTQPV